MDFFAFLGQVLAGVKDDVIEDVKGSKDTLEDLFGTPDNPLQTIDPSTGNVEVQEPDPPSAFSLQVGTEGTTVSGEMETDTRARTELLDTLEQNATTQRVVQKMTAGLEFDYTDFMPGGTRRALRL